jgi:endonuclease/exonuclease/phosphatase (EEP) superfamily protein YafD
MKTDNPGIRTNYLSMKTRYLVKGIGFLSLAGTAIAMSGSRIWLADLTTHLIPQFIVIQILLLIYLIYIDDHIYIDDCLTKTSLVRPGCLFCVLTVLTALTCNYLLVTNIYFPKPSASRNLINSQQLSLTVVNLWSSNPCPEDLVNYLLKDVPHLLVLIEVTPQWEKSLTPLYRNYEHRVLDVREDNFGLALFSKLPILSSKIHRTDNNGRPMIQGIIELSKGKTVEVFAVHPTPPKHPQYFNLRTTYLKTLIELVNSEQTKDIIVAGDFNSTHWSPHFKSILADTKLLDTAQGFGFTATWPTYIPFLLGPIDHCLVSSEIGVLERKRGPFVWSDHFPLELKLNLTDKPEERVFQKKEVFTERQSSEK